MPSAHSRRTQARSQIAYSVEEGGRVLGLGRSKTYELVLAGEIKSFLVGRRRLVSREALLDWVRRQESTA